jgi:hypothetical protein
MMRIRAYHEPSGSVLNGEVTDVLYEKGYEPSYRVIPDGLLESVIVRSPAAILGHNFRRRQDMALCRDDLSSSASWSSSVSQSPSPTSCCTDR